MIVRHRHRVHSHCILYTTPSLARPSHKGDLGNRERHPSTHTCIQPTVPDYPLLNVFSASYHSLRVLFSWKSRQKGYQAQLLPFPTRVRCSQKCKSGLFLHRSTGVEPGRAVVSSFPSLACYMLWLLPRSYIYTSLCPTCPYPVLTCPPILPFLSSLLPTLSFLLPSSILQPSQHSSLKRVRITRTIG